VANGSEWVVYEHEQYVGTMANPRKITENIVRRIQEKLQKNLDSFLVKFSYIKKINLSLLLFFKNKFNKIYTCYNKSIKESKRKAKK
jgi:hypothetical protein